MKVLLFIIALFFTALLTGLWIPFNWIYHIITLKLLKGFKSVNNYFYQMALSIDQFANVSLQTPLSVLLINREYLGHLFGDEDDTVSYCIAMNKKLGSLSKFGLFWAWFLDKVDKDHLQKAIDNKLKRDLEAYYRVVINERER
jgi:hypothetical protein